MPLSFTAPLFALIAMGTAALAPGAQGTDSTSAPTQDSAPAGAAQVQTIGEVLLVVDLTNCSDWPHEVADLFSREEKPEFWRSFDARYVDAASDEGKGILKRFQARSQSILVFDDDDQLVAAKGGFANLAGLGRWLEELSRGEGTAEALRKRIAADPADTEALYFLYEMQRASRLFGDQGESYKAIKVADKDHKMPGGEALHSRRTLGHFFQFAGLRKPEDVKLDSLEELAASTKTPWVRCKNYMSIAVMASKLKQAPEQVNEFYLQAWDACPESWRPEVALDISRSPAWPADLATDPAMDSAMDSAADSRRWPEIVAAAKAAQEKFIGKVAPKPEPSPSPPKPGK